MPRGLRGQEKAAGPQKLFLDLYLPCRQSPNRQEASFSLTLEGFRMTSPSFFLTFNCPSDPKSLGVGAQTTPRGFVLQRCGLQRYSLTVLQHCRFEGLQRASVIKQCFCAAALVQFYSAQRHRPTDAQCFRTTVLQRFRPTALQDRTTVLQCCSTSALQRYKLPEHSSTALQHYSSTALL